MARFESLLLIVAGALLVCACSKSVPTVEPARPVRAIAIAAADASTTLEFSGEIRPRIESRLGFRVGGKILVRRVDVGARVKRGAVLAELDPVDLRLSQASSNAQLVAAKTDLELAEADLKRYTELRAKGFIGAAELERHQNSYASTRARYDQASATHDLQSNQAAYAVLSADADGVVTAVDAEPGQVVTAGQSVIRVARTAEKEVEFAVPEDRVELLRAMPVVQVKLWADPSHLLPARIREISPVADAVTRTFVAKATLIDPPPAVLLGMTAVVVVAVPSGAGAIALPLSALYREGNQTSVWVIDPATMTVSAVPVVIAGASGNRLILSGGVSPGQLVVTAGVNLLEPHQKVTILNEAPPPPEGLRTPRSSGGSAS